MAYDKTKMQDIKSTERAVYLQYQSYMNETPPNWSGIITLLSANPNLTYKVFDSFNWTRLCNLISDKTDTTTETSDSLEGQWSQSLLAQFRYLGNWNSGTAYVSQNLVVDNNMLYLCIQDNTNQEPPNATYWIVAMANVEPFGIPVATTPPTNMRVGDIYFEEL